LRYRDSRTPETRFEYLRAVIAFRDYMDAHRDTREKPGHRPGMEYYLQNPATDPEGKYHIELYLPVPAALIGGPWSQGNVFANDGPLVGYSSEDPFCSFIRFHSL